jgi:hypothetical protein
MIIDLKTGTRFSGVVEYNAKGELLDSNISPFALSSEDAIAHLELTKRANVKASKPVFHAYLSFAPEDKQLVTNDLMVRIGRIYMQRMGFNIDTGDERQHSYVMFRHYDTPSHEHFHIVASRISLDGKYLDMHQSIKKSIKIARDLELEFGLRHVSNEKAKVKGKSKGQLEFQKRMDNWDADFKTGKETLLTSLSRLFRNPGSKPTLKTFIEHLAQDGIEVKFYLQKNRVTGISFRFSPDGYPFVIKGSSLGRNYSWPSIEKRLTYNFEMDRPLMEQANKTMVQHSKDAYRYLTEKNISLKKLIMNEFAEDDYVPKKETKDILDHVVFDYSQIRKIQRNLNAGSAQLENTIHQQYEDFAEKKKGYLNKVLDTSQLKLSENDRSKIHVEFRDSYYDYKNFTHVNDYIRFEEHPFIKAEEVHLFSYLKASKDKRYLKNMQPIEAQALHKVITRQHVFNKMEYLKKAFRLEAFYSDADLKNLTIYIEKTGYNNQTMAILQKFESELENGNVKNRDQMTVTSLLESYSKTQNTSFELPKWSSSIDSFLPTAKELAGIDEDINQVEEEHVKVPKIAKRKVYMRRRGI